jgi:tRNA(Ile)-lysidine synthase
VHNLLFTAPCTELFQHSEHLIVGYSGGLDSTVLLHFLASHAILKKKITAVHIHHGLSPDADHWQQHCEKTCIAWDIPYLLRKVSFNRRANIEENARIARYQAFQEIMQASSILLLAHHLQDQAETVLLNLFRGSGIRGLSAMPEIKSYGEGILARPFLHHTREALLAYATENQLSWIEDNSNQNVDFSRNFVRHRVIPKLELKWPKVVKNLARVAENLKETQQNLTALALIDCPELMQTGNRLALDRLLALEPSRLKNVILIWLHMNKVSLRSKKVTNHIIENMIFAVQDAKPEILWDNIIIRKYHNSLYIIQKVDRETLAPLAWDNFPTAKVINNKKLVALPTTKGLFVPAQAKVTILFRQFGETIFWRKQTKSVKKLLQQWNIPPWERDKIPFLYINNQIAMIVGYAISDKFFSVDGIQTYNVQWQE